MRNLGVEKSFCTTKEAATLLGVSVGTVQLWVESGLLQAWKTAGGHRRVMRESVLRLLHKSTPSASTSAAETLPPMGSAPAPVPPRKLRILVVEDDPNLLRLYEVRMNAWSVSPQVEVTNNAFSALLSMGRSCPDILVTDLHMPGIDGFGMLRALRNAPEAQGMRIVVVSGLDAAEIQARGGLPARVECLGKPVPFDRLQQIAQEVVTEQRLLGALAPAH